MAATYVPLATTTLGSAQSSVTFSSISGSYTDLIVVYAGSGTSVNTQAIYLQFNSDTGTNYSLTQLTGNGSSASSARDTNIAWLTLCSNNTNTSQNNAIMQIANYSNTTTYKTAIWRNNDPSARLQASVGLWRSTSAITTITLKPESGTINSGCTFTIYGIKAA